MNHIYLILKKAGLVILSHYLIVYFMGGVINMQGNGVVMYYMGMDVQTCGERQKPKTEEKKKERKTIPMKITSKIRKE